MPEERYTRIRVEVTEPTMANGVWTLAQFEWLGRVREGRQYTEDVQVGGITGFITESCNQLRALFDEWLEDMPDVKQWHVQFKFMSEPDVLNDWMTVKAFASGWFALSDNETKTEKLLSYVKVLGDQRLNMPELFYNPDASNFSVSSSDSDDFTLGGVRNRERLIVAQGALEAERVRALRIDDPDYWSSINRQLSMLEPRTPDNNINPNFVRGDGYQFDGSTRRVDIGSVHDTRGVAMRTVPRPRGGNAGHPGLAPIVGSRSTYPPAVRIEPGVARWAAGSFRNCRWVTNEDGYVRGAMLNNPDDFDDPLDHPQIRDQMRRMEEENFMSTTEEQVPEPTAQPATTPETTPPEPVIHHGMAPADTMQHHSVNEADPAPVSVETTPDMPPAVAALNTHIATPPEPEPEPEPEVEGTPV